MKYSQFIIGLSLCFFIQPGYAQVKGTHEVTMEFGIASSTRWVSEVGGLWKIITLNTERDRSFSGAFTLGYHHAVSNKLLIGGTFTYERFKYLVDSPNNNPKLVTSNFFTLATNARYHYLSDESFQMYSGLGIGYTFSASNDAFEDTLQYIHLHLNLLGIRIGKSFGGFAELGWGYKGIGNFGISYQF